MKPRRSEENIILCGGRTPEYKWLSSCESYSVARNKWVRFPPMVEKRNGHVLIESNGELFAIGGSDGAHFSNTVEKFDENARRWKIVARLPHPLWDFAVVLYEKAGSAQAG